MDVERDETPAEKADRNWIELLQELRVAQTGIQILAGFLLTIPFSQRFGDMDDGYRTLYLACFGLAAIATGLLIAPVTFHRFLFGQHREGRPRRGRQRARQGGARRARAHAGGGGGARSSAS